MAVYNAFGVNDDDAYDNDVNDADVAPSSNTRSYSLRSVPSSPGRSFLYTSLDFCWHRMWIRQLQTVVAQVHHPAPPTPWFKETRTLSVPLKALGPVAARVRVLLD